MFMLAFPLVMACHSRAVQNFAALHKIDSV